MKKAIHACIFLLIACPAATMAIPQGGLDQPIAELSRQISNEIIENRKTRIAVVEFANIRGEITDVGRLLSEELITRLYQTKKFRVIERQLLNKVIAEQKLSLTGTIDPQSAQRLGELLGVDAIVSGTVTDLGQNMRVNARLINTQTGEIFAAASTQVPKSALGNLVDDAGPSSPPIASKPKEKEPAKKIVEARFFAFELSQCRLSGTSVICDFQITNKDKDRNLGLWDGTRMFDEFGNEAQARDMELANSGRGYDVTLVSRVPTRARVTFEGVSPQATKITLLELRCGDERGEFYARFRNICLTESCNGGR